MLGFALRKKINQHKLANIFVNSLIEVVENGHPEIIEMINEDPAFVYSPNLSNKHYLNQFLLIVIVGNLEFLKQSFQDYDVDAIENEIIEKFASVFDVTPQKFKSLLKNTKAFIDHNNYPSKNILYGLSKAIFYKYKLNNYQESYFKSMNTPNPLFLKRLDELLINFMWDWDMFLKRFKLN
ncbi:MAG TPA: hypothetical protein EYG85_03225 [Crocinitomix sp.]|nr:hypothetical protein [Crocinitomix sp.]